jgi:hypothetical protein
LGEADVGERTGGKPLYQFAVETQL